MAVEENVKENTPKAEGEAQGVKYIFLTEEELERLIKAAGREGAKKGVEAYERRKEKDKEELADKVKNSAKTIIIHYRQLKKMKNKIVMSIVINNKSKVSYIYSTTNKICLPYFYIVL